MDELSIYILGLLDEDQTEKNIAKSLNKIQQSLKDNPIKLKAEIEKDAKKISEAAKSIEKSFKEIAIPKLDFEQLKKENVEIVRSIDEVRERLSKLGTVSFDKTIDPNIKDINNIKDSVISFVASVKQANGETKKFHYTLADLGDKGFAYIRDGYKLVDKTAEQSLKDRQKVDELLLKSQARAAQEKIKWEEAQARAINKNLELEYKRQQAEERRIRGLGIRITELPTGIFPKEYVHDYTAIENYISALDRFRNKTIDSIKTHYDHRNALYTTTVMVRNKTGELDKYVFKLDQATNSLYEYSRVPRASIQRDVELFHQIRIALQRIPLWFFSMTLFMQPIRSIRQGVQGILDVDAAMTELMRVTEATKQEYQEFVRESHHLASALGRTTAELIQGTSAWARLGYTLQEAKALAQETAIFASVGDITTEEASNYLISTIRGFKIAVDETGESVRGVVDVFNEVGNKFAVSSAGIGEALMRSASALQVAGNTLEESAALVAAANAIVQDPAKVGNALKTLSLRIRGVTDEGEELEDLVPKLEEQFNALGLTLMKDENTFKSTYEVFKDLAGVWDQLTDFQRANILELVAGKEQANVAAALLENFEDAEKALEAALNSAGSAAKEMEAYYDSFEYRIVQLRNNLDLLWSNFADNDTIKELISLFSSFIGILAKLVEHVGGFATAVFLAVPALVALTGTGHKFLSFANLLFPTLGGLADQFKRKTREAKTSTESLRVLGVTFNKTAAQAAALRVALAGLQLVATLGVGLALSALAYGISEVITRFVQKRKETKQLRKELDDLAISYGENKQQIDTLIKRYDELSKATNDGRNFKNTQQEEEYLRIQNEIAELLPTVVKEYDKYGNARLKNLDIIKDEIRLLEERNKKLEEQALIERTNELENNIKQYEQLVKKLEELNLAIEKGRPTTRYVGGQRQVVYVPYSEEYRIQLQLEQGPLLTQIENLKRVIEDTYIIKLKAELDTYGIEINDALEQEIRKLIHDLDLFGKSGEEAEKIIDNIVIAFSNLNKQISDNELAALSRMTGIAVNDLKNLQGVLQDSRASFDNLSDSIDDSTDSLSELHEVFDEAYRNIDRLNGIIEELNENHRLSGDSIAYIIEKYPELIAFINDEHVLKQKLIEITKQESKIAQQELHNKLMVSRSYYENLIKYNSDFYKYMYDTYKVDLENYKNLAQAKAAVEDRLIQKLMGNWSRYIKVVNNQVRLTEDFWVGQMQFGGLSNPINREIIRKASRLQEELNKFYTTFNNIALPSLDLRGINLSSRASASSSSGSKSSSSGSKSKSITKTQVEPYVIDKFAQALADLNLKLEQSEYRASRLAETSDKYANELMIQIGLLKERQRLIQQERQSLQNQKQLLSREISRTKDIEKRNELLREYESIQNKIRELTAQNWDIATQITEKYFERYSIAVQRIRDRLDEWSQRLEISNARLQRMEQGTAQWFKELKEQERIINRQIELVQQEMDQIQKMMKYDLLSSRQKAELQKRYRDLTVELERYKTQLNDIQKTMRDHLTQEAKSLQDEIVEIYKEAYRKQLEIALDAHDKEVESYRRAHQQKMRMLDEEMKKYEEIVNQKLKEIDREQEYDDFNKQLTEQQQKRRELLNQIEILSLDDSIEARNRKHELEKQLAEVEERITEITTRRQRDLRRQALQDELEEVRKNYEEKKEIAQREFDERMEQYEQERKAIQRHYENLIHDERRFAQIREQIMKGHLNTILNDLNIFIRDVRNNMALLGESISQNFIDRINEAKKALQELDYAALNKTTKTTGTQSSSSSTTKGTTQTPTQSSGGTSNSSKQSGSSSKPSSTTYTVKKGDTLWDIARKYYGSGLEWRRIMNANPSVTDPYNLPIGTKLVIPFDTGGYTGNYEGLAYLHKKELVLNDKDTRNILETVRLVRDLYLKSMSRSSSFPRLPRERENRGTVIEKMELHFNGFQGNRRDAQEITDIIVRDLRKRGVNV